MKTLEQKIFPYLLLAPTVVIFGADSVGVFFVV